MVIEPFWDLDIAMAANIVNDRIDSKFDALFLKERALSSSLNLNTFSNIWWLKYD